MIVRVRARVNIFFVSYEVSLARISSLPCLVKSVNRGSMQKGSGQRNLLSNGFSRVNVSDTPFGTVHVTLEVINTD